VVTVYGRTRGGSLDVIPNLLTSTLHPTGGSLPLILAQPISQGRSSASGGAQDTSWPNVIIYQTLTFPASGDDVTYPPPRNRLAVDEQPNLLTSTLAAQTVAPIVPRDWPAPRRPGTAQDTAQRNLLPYLLAPIPLPPVPRDLTQPRSSKGVTAQDTQQANGLIVLNAPNALPFFAVDLTPNLRPRAPQTQDTAQRDLLLLLLPPASLPFIASDLGQPRVGVRPQDTAGPNVIIYQTLTFPASNNDGIIFTAPRRSVSVDAPPNLLTSTLAQSAPLPPVAFIGPQPRVVVARQDTQSVQLMIYQQLVPPVRPVDLTYAPPRKRVATQLTDQQDYLLWMPAPLPYLVGDPLFIVKRSPARTFTVSTSMTNLRFNAKDPSESTVLTFDFSPDLATGEILTGTPTVLSITVPYGVDPSPNAIQNGALGFDSTTTKVLMPVQAGNDATDYLIVVQSTTSNPDKILALAATLPVRR
jgi:hypothetical protein